METTRQLLDLLLDEMFGSDNSEYSAKSKWIHFYWDSEPEQSDPMFESLVPGLREPTPSEAGDAETLQPSMLAYLEEPEWPEGLSENRLGEQGRIYGHLSISNHW